MAVGVVRGKKCSLFDHIPEHITNLSQGTPPDSMLQSCAEMHKTGALHMMEKDSAYTFMNYGPEEGASQYREAVATLLREEYSAPVDSDDIILTMGATHGLHLVAHLLFSPGDIAFVENPTYPPAISLLRDEANLHTLGIPMDSNGINVEALEEVVIKMKTMKSKEFTEVKPFWGLLYVLSSFHTPCGMNLAPGRCQRLVELAREHNLLIVCDDVYNMLYHDTPPRRLFSYDNMNDSNFTGNVVSNGSFSKVFGPGIRLGWMETPQRVKELLLRVGCARSGGSYNHVSSGIMTSIINLGLLQDMLKRSRALYKEQCEALCGALQAEIPSAEFVKPMGGFFVWMKLPDGIIANDLLELCKRKYKVIFSLGERASVNGDFKNFILLAFSRYDKEILKDGIVRLGQAIKELSIC